MVEQLRLEAWVEPETVTKKYLNYSTQWHKLRTTQTAIDTFLERLKKASKKGQARYTDKERHLLMCEFIIKKAKVKVEKLNGAEWEISQSLLLNEIFKEPWDRDFDKDGKEKSSSQKFADALSSTRGEEDAGSAT